MKYEVKDIDTPHGKAKGLSAEWENGQYCAILTPKGQVACAIFDLTVMEEFGMVGAIAKGTPENPLKEPEDLYEATIVGVTSKALDYGIIEGMPGKEALFLLLKSSEHTDTGSPTGISNQQPV